jgi:hypothetical protein
VGRSALRFYLVWRRRRVIIATLPYLSYFLGFGGGPLRTLGASGAI